MGSAGNGDNPVYFLVTIDTEEDNAWNLDFLPHTELSVDNIQYLPAFQQFCERLGIRPTYLVNYPVVANAAAVKVIRSLAETGQCEIGTHIHPWCNPPYEEERNHRNSYLNNLPQDLQLKKMQQLTEAIEEAVGVRPVSYRAGRYGFDESSVPVLETLGYRVDSSVVPYRKNKHPDEPNFDAIPLTPYYLNPRNVCRPGDSSVLEVPITVEFTRQLPFWFKKRYPDLPDIGIRRLLRVVAGVELAWLRPSYASLETMKRLADSVVASGVPVLNMMFHSSELMPGGSPYNRTPADVEHFLQKIEALVTYLTQRYSLRFVTLAEMTQYF